MSRRSIGLLCLIVFAGFALDFVFYTGFFASDDIGYIGGAHALATGSDYPTTLSGIRLGITVPGGLAYWISGGEAGAVAWLHILYHLGLILMAFVLGRMLSGDSAGFFAALVVALNPLFYVFAGAVLPDNPMAFWLGMVLILLIQAQRRALEEPLSNARAFVWYFTMGILLGVAYMCKETAVIMTIPMAACIMVAAPSLKSTVWIRNGAFLAAGLVAALLIEMLVLRQLTGDWMFRLGGLQSETVQDIYADRMSWQGRTPSERFRFAWVRRLRPFVPYTGWILAIVAAVYPFVRKRSLALLLFFWWPFVYITIGSTSFSSYRPPTIQTRYYSVAILPAAVMLGILVVRAAALWAGSKKLPAWAQPGRLAAGTKRGLIFAVATIVVLVSARVELGRNAPRSGNIYRRYQVRGFVAAYEAARARYPHYPIVLSRYYRDKMRTILLPRIPEDVTVEEGKPPPAAPYLYIERLKALEETSGLGPRRSGEDYVQTLDVFYPVATRIDVLSNSVRRFFSVSPRRTLANSSHGASVLQLVSVEPHQFDTWGKESLLGATLHSLGEAEIQVNEEGFFVTWENPGSHYLQYFDRRSYKRPSKKLEALVEGGPRSLDIEVDLRLVRGDSVVAIVHGYAYLEDGQHVHESKSVELVAGSGAKTALVNIRAESPIQSYKARIKLKARSNSGGIQISAPRVGLPEPEPTDNKAGERGTVLLPPDIPPDERPQASP